MCPRSNSTRSGRAGDRLRWRAASYNKADIKQPYGIIATNGRVHDAFRRELIPVCESRGWPRREPQ